MNVQVNSLDSVLLISALFQRDLQLQGIGIESSVWNLPDQKKKKNQTLFLFGQNSTDTFIQIKPKTSRCSKQIFKTSLLWFLEIQVLSCYFIFYSFCFSAKTNICFISVSSFLMLHLLFSVQKKCPGQSFQNKKGEHFLTFEKENILE